VWLKLNFKFCLFPVSLAVPSQIYPSVKPEIEVKSIERKWQQIDFDQISPQPSRPLPERDDDWFVLFDAIREEAVILPSGIQLMYFFTQSEFTLKHIIIFYDTYSADCHISAASNQLLELNICAVDLLSLSSIDSICASYPC